ncbi:MAG: BrnA antitoxin family protein [Thermomicrobiales bacterium]
MKSAPESSRPVTQPALSEHDIEQLRRQYAHVDEVNATIRDEDIDLSDIPEWTADQVAAAGIGPLYRPRKDQLTLRLDADVVAWFRHRYPKYQTAMNAALRASMEIQIARDESDDGEGTDQDHAHRKTA